MLSVDRRALARRDWILLSVLAAAAAAVRLVSVRWPSRTVVDEFWYARDGCYYWRRSAEACGLRHLVAPDRDVRTWLARYHELTPEHPPLAKWLIGAPEAVLGYGPGAWRLAAVVAGAATVALLYVLVKRALASTWAAAAASGLLAVDYLHVVHSRLAMLEIFVAFFAVAAFTFTLLDRGQIEARAEGRPAHGRWRVAAGVAAGAAAACKLSGAAVVLGVLALTAAWEIGARRRARRPLGARAVAAVVLPLAVLPLAVYVLTYAGRLDGSLVAAPWEQGSWVRAWAERQWYMLSFQAEKPSGGTPFWALPMTGRPLPYALDPTPHGVREILLFGNPFLWWAGFLATAVAAVRWARGDRGPAAAVAVVGFLAGYAGWLSIVLSRRPVHLFYAVPVAPFLYLSLAYVGTLLVRARAARVAAAAAVAAAVAAFAFYVPILIGRPLTRPQWRLRACSAQALWLDRRAGCGLGNGGSANAP